MSRRVFFLFPSFFFLSFFLFGSPFDENGLGWNAIPHDPLPYLRHEPKFSTTDLASRFLINARLGNFLINTGGKEQLERDFSLDVYSNGDVRVVGLYLGLFRIN